jgi:hypothetical protein
VAQAVEEQVEQPSGLVALSRGPGHEGHAAEAGQDVGGVNVATESRVGGARLQQRADGIDQGAATSVLVATSPLLDSIGGRYFEDCNEAVVLAPAAQETSGSGVAPYALDPEAAARLWQVSAAG